MQPIHLAVSAGDPQGVGLYVALHGITQAMGQDPLLRVTLCGPQRQLMGLVDAHEFSLDFHRLAIVDCPFEASGSGPSASGGACSLEALNAAASLVESGEAQAIVTSPLSKEAVAMGEPGFTGHTDYLAQRSQASVLMMLANRFLRVSLATTHLPLCEVGASLSEEKLLSQLTLLRSEVSKRFCCCEPQIAVLALNPHGGENGLLGKEEETIIRPAIHAAGGAAAGIWGPFSADTFFLPGRFEKYDAVLAMYHDQGLIPVKMLGPHETVNITLGLPYVRTSPDHGTGFDLDPAILPNGESMLAAIHEAKRLVRI